MPQEMVDQVRKSPRWAELEAMAPTMAYDSEDMGDISRGGTIPADLLDAVTIPTLVGGASPAWMIDVWAGSSPTPCRTDNTAFWRARSTLFRPRCSYRCWRSSLPAETTRRSRRTQRVWQPRTPWCWGA
jgi:hypothetical protein